MKLKVVLGIMLTLLLIGVLTLTFNIQPAKAETPSVEGDVNFDGIVDLFDMVLCALAYGSRPGDHNWNPYVDLNQDGLIDLFDLVKIAVNYGKTASALYVIDRYGDVTSYSYNQKHYVRTSNSLYAVYPKKLNGIKQIWIKNSTNDGQTWNQTATRISDHSSMDNYNQYLCCIAIDSNDNFHVVWEGESSSYSPFRQMWYSNSSTGTSWQSPVRISTYPGMNGSYQQYPIIAIDGNDALHVTWQGGATGYAIPQVWYAKKDTSWSTPIRLSTLTGMNAQQQWYPTISPDGSNNLHVVWRGGDQTYGTYHQVWYVNYTTSWSTPVRISTMPGMSAVCQHEPCLAVDSNGDVHVVWMGETEGAYGDEIWYTERTSSGWSTPIKICNATGMDDYIQYDPCIAIDAIGDPHVMWNGKATGFSDRQVWYAERYDNGSWSTPINKTSGGQHVQVSIRWSYYNHLEPNRFDFMCGAPNDELKSGFTFL